MNRIFFLILIFLFLLGSVVWAAPVIEEAAEVWQQNLEYPTTVIEISEDVMPKPTVVYATSSFKKELSTNAVLQNTAGSITSHIIIDYASSSFKRDLFPILFPVEMGDVNCDGIINLADALLVLQISVGMNPDSPVCPCSGMDSEKIKMNSALYILQVISQLR